MNTRKLISIILTVVITVSLTMSFSVAKAQSGVKIELFGEITTLPEEYGSPFIDATTSRTLVPARGLFETMGATVNWMPETRNVVIKKDELEIKLKIDSTLAFTNSKAVVLDQSPVIVSDRTYVPLRFIAESLSLNVDFDGTTTTVIIKESVKLASKEGVYKVGEGIDATEYLFVANKDAAKGNVKVKLLRGEDPSIAENIITTIDFKNSMYISLIGCKYVELVGCTAHSLDTLPQRVTNGSCENGMFKIGKELEAGIYAVSRLDSKQPASYKMYYFPFSTSGTNKAINEASISANKNITLKNGQYILLDNAKITKLQNISSGNNGSNSSGSRPIIIPSTTATPTPPATPTPTVQPTKEPQATNEPTETPSVSTEEFYSELDAVVYDFGYHFNIPLENKDMIDFNMPFYIYDITSTELIIDGAVNIEYLKNVYGSKFINDGYVEKSIPNLTTSEYSLGEYNLYNPETGIWVICDFGKETFSSTTYYSANITFLYNPIIEENFEEVPPPPDIDLDEDMDMDTDIDIDTDIE